LQASTVHVYLTQPFILSWSFLEAMGAGCCIVGSATPPVQEVMIDNVNGLLANIHSPRDIARRIEEALDNPELRVRLRKNARETILEQYDLKNCLHRQLMMIEDAVRRK
jgi:glycosyltransferase involved in cell wall biosynthesis